MPTLAIIHTTPATVESLKALAAEILPGYEIINLVDDSILPQLARNGGDLSQVEGRLLQYAQIASDTGADVILEACSSVGEVVSKMAQTVSIPVVRIDDAMAEAAMQRGQKIGVAATLPTTLNPTKRLLEAKAQAAGKSIVIQTALAESAYRNLMAGDRDGHDADLVTLLVKLAEDVDVVVLAQASMARVIPMLPPELQDKILTSPRLGMERVKAALSQ
jgi:aspartate/glutamate racemase